MKTAQYYLRACFIFTLLEAIPRCLNAGYNLFSGKAILWALLYAVLFGLMMLLSFRVFHRHHIPSARGLMTLRVSLCLALIVHYLLTKPLPPISILMVREFFPLFQFFLAYKAHQYLNLLAIEKST